MCRLCNNGNHEYLPTSSPSYDRLKNARDIVFQYTGKYPCKKALFSIKTFLYKRNIEELDQYIIKKLLTSYGGNVYGGKRICQTRQYLFTDKPKEQLEELKSKTTIITVCKNIVKKSIIGCQTKFIAKSTKFKAKSFNTLEEAIQYRDSTKESK